MILTFKNKTKNPFKNILLFILISLFFGCTNSYESLIEKFNETYFSREVTESSVKNQDFVAEEMLEPKYDFYIGYDSNLSAPADCATYNWKIYIEDTEPAEYKELCTEKDYYFVPGKDFEAGSEIKVILTVTDESGTVYIDSTIIKINRELPI